MNKELLIIFGGLLCLAIGYLIGAWHTDNRTKNTYKNKRIMAVLWRYLDLRKSDFAHGFDGLLKSGVATLETDEEIRELIGKIVSHGESSPVGESKQLDAIDLKIFFDYAARESLHFHRVSIKEIIEKSEAQI